MIMCYLCQILLIFFCLKTQWIPLGLLLTQNHIFQRFFHSWQKSISPGLCSFFKWLEFLHYLHLPIPPFPDAERSQQIPQARGWWCLSLLSDTSKCLSLGSQILLGVSDDECQKLLFRCLGFNETQAIHCQVAPSFILKLSICYHVFA